MYSTQYYLSQQPICISVRYIKVVDNNKTLTKQQQNKSDA